MAFNNTALAALAALESSAPVASSNGTREKAKLWLNIGYEHPTLGFVSLPFNISLDSQEPLDENKGSEAWQAICKAKNILLNDLKTYVQSLEPNSGEIIGNLQIQGFHVGEKQSTVNPETLNLVRFIRKA